MQRRECLVQLFRRHKVFDIKTLVSKVKGRTTRTLFRDLRKLGYLASYSHAGQYYTLRDIATFDGSGLWFFRGEIGFSQFGSLKATVASFVEASERGYYHKELVAFLRVRVHNPLLELTRQGRIARQRTRRGYLYLSTDPSKAAEQVRSREGDEAKRPPSSELVIAVLVEALRLCDTEIEPAVVVQRLAVKSLLVSVREVEEILAQHGLTEKKTAPPTSTPLRP